MLGAAFSSVAAGGRAPPVKAAQQNSIEQVLDNPGWPEKFPFGPEAFERYDESPDTEFYSYPRFVTHIDDNAIKSLTDYYAKVFPPSGNKDVAILDICSSWVSHYPKGYTAGKISGLGMNADELAKNSILSDYAVKDLNEDPILPYPDNHFDVVTNTVSVDYLVKPLEVHREIHRVLKPGGVCINSFSNRCFPTKAIAIWTATGDPDHVWIVGSYFHYSVLGGYTEPKAIDITPKSLFGATDPMYVVTARKMEAAKDM